MRKTIGTYNAWAVLQHLGFLGCRDRFASDHQTSRLDRLCSHHPCRHDGRLIEKIQPELAQRSDLTLALRKQ